MILRVSPFAWQSNKVILFYFTQNSVPRFDSLEYREAELLASKEAPIVTTEKVVPLGVRHEKSYMKILQENYSSNRFI